MASRVDRHSGAGLPVLGRVRVLVVPVPLPLVVGTAGPSLAGSFALLERLELESDEEERRMTDPDRDLDDRDPDELDAGLLAARQADL
jgi:hypothetical protein